MSAICPECDSPIDVDEYDVDIGDELTCSECGSLLRVSSDSPVEFELADEEDDLDAEDDVVVVGNDDDDADDDDEDEDEDKSTTTNRRRWRARREGRSPSRHPRRLPIRARGLQRRRRQRLPGRRRQRGRLAIAPWP